MKHFYSLLVLFVASATFAGEPKATLCSDKAIAGAQALFEVNNGPGGIERSTDLVDMDHTEGGYEVWDVSFTKGGVVHSPYRMTVAIDGCVVIGFSIPTAP
jgi:hypothetical protein